MLRGTRARATVGLLMLGVVFALSGCPLSIEKEQRDNAAPNTFFDSTPPDTTFQNEVSFRWLGTDLDSDVVAFQYQLVEVDSLYYFTNGANGTVIRSLDPRSESGEQQWTERVTDNFQTFRDLDDGWYEMRARSIDSGGQPDESPATKAFFVFFDDIPPVPEIRSTCGRIGALTSYVFEFTASDASRRATTPRSAIEYAVQLRSNSCSMCPEHCADSFTDWRRFPDNDVENLLTAGNSPPTVYSDLFSRPCVFTFTLRVRDPARLLSVTSCDVRTEQ